MLHIHAEQLESIATVPRISEIMLPCCAAHGAYRSEGKCNKWQLSHDFIEVLLKEHAIWLCKTSRTVNNKCVHDFKEGGVLVWLS
jgi:hypothetical protein